MQDNRPLVSVIIPAYNNAKFLSATITSVLTQTYKNIEIIAINDGSTDDTFEVLNLYVGSIKVIQSPNMGAAHARNLGLRVANGSLVAFLDSDDLWTANKIEKQFLTLIEKDLDLVYCSGKEFDGSGSMLKTHKAKFSGNCYPYFSELPTVAIITLGCSTAVFKTELIEKSGLFDENFRGPAEDWDFFRRVCRYANVGFIDEELVQYRIHDKNISRSSAISYFEGNRMAISKMLSEDKTLNRLRVWFSFYLVFIKESIKTLNGLLFVIILRSLFRVNY